LDQEVGAVVIDVDANINYIKMMKAVLHLKDPECMFVVGGNDVIAPFEDMNIIGVFLSKGFSLFSIVLMYHHQ